MMRSALIVTGIISILLFFSCGGKENTTGSKPEFNPDSVIAPAKMALILSDIHILEAGLLLKRNESIDQKEPVEQYYAGIFGKYHISRDRYNMNLEYYQNDPDEFVKIYDQVVKILETRQKQVTATN